MRGSARIATYLGRAMIAIGLILLFLGWNFAAEQDCAQCQFPYLLSSSIPGLALIIIGLALEYVQTTRELTARRAREAAALDASLSRLVGFVRDGDALRPGFDPDDTIPPPPEHDLAMLDASASVFTPPASGGDTSAASSGGDDSEAQPDAGQGGSTAVEQAVATEVVAGRSSYHRPDCRLVTNRDDMRTMERDAAEREGLSPCRICNP